MLRVANCPAFSCCHQFVNHPVYNPMDAIWVARLPKGSDLWQCWHQGGVGEPQDAKIRHQNVLCVAGRLVTRCCQEAPEGTAACRHTAAHWLLARQSHFLH